MSDQLCPYCHAPITVGTAYSVPVVTPPPTQKYGSDRKAPGVGTAYSCKRDECKAQLRRAHGVREQ